MLMLKVIFHAYNPLPPNFFSKGKEILILNILLIIIIIILDVTKCILVFYLIDWLRSGCFHIVLIIVNLIASITYLHQQISEPSFWGLWFGEQWKLTLVEWLLWMTPIIIFGWWKWKNCFMWNFFINLLLVMRSLVI